MASEHDRAVLRAIFNPTTPFGDNSDLNQTEPLDDDGECAHVEGILSLSLYTTLKLFLYIRSRSTEEKERKKKHDVLIQLDLCVTPLSFLCRHTPVSGV